MCLYNFYVKTESISVESVTSLIVAVFERISVEYPISSLPATQFTVEKSDFELQVTVSSYK